MPTLTRTPRQAPMALRAAYADDDAPLFPEPAPAPPARPAAYRAACAVCGVAGQFRAGSTPVCPFCRNDLDAAHDRVTSLLAQTTRQRWVTRNAALDALRGHVRDAGALLDTLEGARSHRVFLAAAAAIGAERWAACRAAVVAAHQAAIAAERCARAAAALRAIEGGRA